MGALNPPLKRPHYFQKPGYGPAHKHHHGTKRFSGEEFKYIKRDEVMAKIVYQNVVPGESSCYRKEGWLLSSQRQAKLKDMKVTGCPPPLLETHSHIHRAVRPRTKSGSSGIWLHVPGVGSLAVCPKQTNDWWPRR